MKRLAVTLYAVILLVLLLPSFPIFAQPARVPHQDPATTGDSLNPLSMLRFYGNVLDMAATRQYQGAQAMLNELDHASIPDELHQTISLARSLADELVSTLNNVESLLDEASALFAAGQIGDAELKLKAAETDINSAQLLLDDIEAAINSLGGGMGIPGAVADSDIRQAYERQREVLSRLRRLIDELNQLRENLLLDPGMVLSTSFHHPTFLEVSAPDTAYPGLPIAIVGQVSSTGDAINRSVRVFLDSTPLAEATVPGQFSLKITPPLQTASGVHTLTVTVPAQGRCTGAATSMPINIYQVPIQTEIQIPQLIITPEMVRVSGQVRHSLGPLRDAQVTLTFKKASKTVQTSAEGYFDAVIEAPLDLSLMGPQRLEVTVEPVEPWYGSLKTSEWIFAINPANVGLMLLAGLSLGVVLLRRARARPLGSPGETVVPEAESKEPFVAPAPRARHEFKGSRGRILLAYLDSVEVVGEAVGIVMIPQTTLREFLRAASPKMTAAVEPFTELTMMAERALYSAHTLEDDVAAEAEALAAQVQEEFHSGAA